jgi:sarcosine oxidase
MGAATARVLSSRGHKVTVYEQFGTGHTRGSSHGATRIYRFSYPDPRYVAMMSEALVLWHELETESRVTLLTKTGGLDCGRSLEDHARSLEEHGVPFEVLPPAEAHRRWPSLNLPGDSLYQADGGYVRADLAWKSFLDSALSAGAELERQKVEDLHSLEHDRVVVTAGSWARALLATVGIDLPTRATRETVAFFRMTESLPTLVDWGDPSVYALPDPTYGLKVGEHIAGPTTDPDKDGDVNGASVGRLRDWVADRYPGVDPEPAHAETCLYTNTADEHFVLERNERLVIGSACSGHGFKFAPLIGKRLADLAEA